MKDLREVLTSHPAVGPEIRPSGIPRGQYQIEFETRWGEKRVLQMQSLAETAIKVAALVQRGYKVTVKDERWV